ncbi:MAG: RIO1 family regulatory kinase/ATPase [Nitrososphaerales archaeon]
MYSIQLEALAEAPYSNILCYPNPTPPQIQLRLKELKDLGVKEIILDGRVEISGLKVLGKGCVSIVVIAKWEQGEAALKIRRIDANRPNLNREAELLTAANKLDVGPKLYKYSDNFILMELIKGINLPQWVKDLKGRGAASKLRSVCKNLLDKCWRLDQAGLDHGELSNLNKHVLVADRVEIIDFESASTERAVRNLTSAAQYLFVGGPVANKARRILNLKNQDIIIEAIRYYKKQKASQNAYHQLLEQLKLVKATKHTL